MGPRAKEMLVFLAFVFLFTSLPYFLMIHTGHVGAGDWLVVMWCPALAALTTCRLLRIGLASLGWSWRPSRYVGWAYVVPILYALPVYVATWTFIPGSFSCSTLAARIGASFGFPG